MHSPKLKKSLKYHKSCYSYDKLVTELRVVITKGYGLLTAGDNDRRSKRFCSVVSKTRGRGGGRDLSFFKNAVLRVRDRVRVGVRVRVETPAPAPTPRFTDNPFAPTMCFA